MKLSVPLSILTTALPATAFPAVTNGGPLPSHRGSQMQLRNVKATGNTTDAHEISRRGLVGAPSENQCDESTFERVVGAWIDHFGEGGEFRGSKKDYPNFRIACCSGWCMFMAGEGKTLRHWTEDQFDKTVRGLRNKVFNREQQGICHANPGGYTHTVEGTHGARIAQPKYIKRRKEMYLRFMPEDTDIWGHWDAGTGVGTNTRVGSLVKGDSCNGGNVYEGPFLEESRYVERKPQDPFSKNPDTGEPESPLEERSLKMSIPVEAEFSDGGDEAYDADDDFDDVNGLGEPDSPLEKRSLKIPKPDEPEFYDEEDDFYDSGFYDVDEDAFEPGPLFRERSHEMSNSSKLESFDEDSE